MSGAVTVASGRLAALTNDHWLSASPGADPVVAGPPVILMVPGYTGSKEDFAPLLPALAELGFRAVAIDQLGQYESGWAAGPTGYAIESLAADVLAVLAQLRPRSSRVHLLGHSFGGLVCRAAVLSDPDAADTLTLMDSGPAAIVGRRLTALEIAEPVLATQGQAAVWRLISSEVVADPKFARAAPELLAFLERRFLANDPMGLKVMGEELRTVADRTDELARLTLPILVVHGENDDAWPPDVQAAMAKTLRATHRVIPEAAHSPAVENPAATLRALV
ncbi:MAG: Lysophospholipase, partial [Frankiales bacterium]|nr:Lysophospholipase [Frankiales bacterium]